MSTSTKAFHTHLVRIERSLAFALATQDPDDPQLQASFLKEVEAGVACLHGCVARNESVQPTLLMLSAVAESLDAQKSSRTINFKAIRKEDVRIVEGWRAAAMAETPTDIGDLGENCWWEGAAQCPREADVGATSAKTTRIGDSACTPMPTEGDPVADLQPSNPPFAELVPAGESLSALVIGVEGKIISPIVCARCASMHAGCYVDSTAGLTCVLCRITKRPCSLVPKSPGHPRGHLRGTRARRELESHLAQAQAAINRGEIPHPQPNVPPFSREILNGFLKRSKSAAGPGDFVSTASIKPSRSSGPSSTVPQNPARDLPRQSAASPSSDCRPNPSTSSIADIQALIRTLTARVENMEATNKAIETLLRLL